jgi:hypothetical protein
VRVSDLAELAELTVTALARSLAGSASGRGATWDAPRADDMVASDLPIQRLA